jgi:hypothetical protein
MGRYSVFIASTVACLFFIGLVGVFNCTDPKVSNMGEVAHLNNDFRLKFSMAIERFYRKSLTINELGHCELVVESNIEQPNTPAIGLYLTQIGAEKAAELRDRMIALADVPLQEEGPFQPGEPLFEASLEQEGETQTRIFDPHTVPKRYQVIGRQIIEIEKNARKNMVSGLRLDFTLNSRQIDREKPLGLTLQFTAVGKELVRFYNPLHTPPDGFGRIVVGGVRTDVKAEDLQFFHRQSHDLSMEMQKEQPPLQLRETVVNLKPGETLSSTFDVVLDWPPGSYDVELTMDTNGSTEDDKNFVIGRITTPPQQLAVTGTPKPGDEGATHYEPPQL